MLMSTIFTRITLCLLACLFTAMTALAGSDSITLQYQRINGFEVKFVTINMTDPDVVVTTALAQSFPHGLERWENFLGRLQPDVAINGTYFCLRSYMPVGDIAVDGDLVYSGVVGTALCITPDNKVVMRPGPQQMKPEWLGFRTVLCAGPRLLTNGQLSVNARAEGFRDPHVLGSASRSAVAWRPDGLLVFLTISQNISLTNLAYVCQHLGAVDAMALDGGSSSALYAEGRTITRPGRGLSNVLVVYSSQQKYREMAQELAPRGLTRIARLLPTVSPYTAVAAAQPNIPMAPMTSPLVTATSGIIRLAKLDTAQPVRGTVPLTIEVLKNRKVSWTSLRINGVLRAMGNVWPLQYDWDSTKEKNGMHTVEVTAWAADRSLLAREVHQLDVQNDQHIAQR